MVQEKRTFFCEKHQCFHTFLINNKASKIYKKCVKENCYKFKEHMDNSELFQISFRRQWKQEKANYYKT